MTRSFTIKGKTYEIGSFEGTVLESSRQRETKVTGSGGGGATWDGYGGTAPVNIKSETTIHDEFFLLNEDGVEKDFHLTNWDVPLRAGHFVQVIWLFPPKSSTGWHVVLNNKNLNKLEWNHTMINDIAKKHYRSHLWRGYFLVIILWAFAIQLIGKFIKIDAGAITYVPLLLIAVYLIYRYMTNEIRNQIYNELRKYII